MMHPRDIPKGARLMGSHDGRIEAPGASNHGKTARAFLWEAHCSQGYKSGYQRKPTRFVAVFVDGQKPWAKRYSGKNYEAARVEWDRVRTLIVKDREEVISR